MSKKIAAPPQPASMKIAASRRSRSRGQRHTHTQRRTTAHIRARAQAQQPIAASTCTYAQTNADYQEAQTRNRKSSIGEGEEPTSWPLQDIVSLQSFLGGVKHPFIAPPLAKATLLQCYCTTVVLYTTPSPDPQFVCHTLYNISNGNIV